MVKNSAVIVRETKVESSTTGVGMLSTKLRVAGGRENLKDRPQKCRSGEASWWLSGISSRVK